MTTYPRHDGTRAVGDAVTRAFEALLKEIRKQADDGRMRAAEEIVAGNDAEAERCLVTSRRLEAVHEEIRVTYDAWRNGIRVSEPPSVQAKRSDSTKPRKRSNFRVYLDKTLIEERTAADTFCQALEKIGLARVARLGKRLSGIPLIGESRSPGYQNQRRVGGYFVCTHASNNDKKRVLEEVANELGVSLTVELT